MGKVFKNFNLVIFISVCFLGGLSLVLILSTAPWLLSSQLLFFLLGFVLFFLFHVFDTEVLKSLTFPLYFFSLLFLGLSFFGPAVRGAHRWVEVFGFKVQPSELVKPFLIVFLSRVISSFPPQNISFIIFHLALITIPSFLVFKQPDLGNAILYFGTGIVMMISRGLKPSFIFYLLLFILILSPLFWNFLKDYQKLRILSFLNPTAYSQTASYHSIQAKISVGSGGVWGKGLGRGTQSHLKFLPEYHTDFIFSSLCEELGFLGGVLVLGCYFFLLLQILKVASATKDPFSYLFLTGVFTQLLLQVFINVGMNLGLIPITGITLPLVSYGGSSIVSTLTALGMVSSLKRKGKPKILVLG